MTGESPEPGQVAEGMPVAWPGGRPGGPGEALASLPAAIRARMPEPATWRPRPAGDSNRVFHVVGDGDEVYLKVRSLAETRFGSLHAEADRMQWLQSRVPVPRTLAIATDGEYEYLVTSAVSGTPSHQLGRPEAIAAVVDRVAKALRDLHGIDVRDCPFRRASVGPESDRDRVVVHGDFCLPNVLLTGDGGYWLLDLADVGAGDRYVDIVAVLWSVEHNFGRGWEQQFLAQYGLPEIDVFKLRAYREWWLSV